jgi:methylenetetrahydrofolate reductase (NADPH)
VHDTNVSPVRYEVLPFDSAEAQASAAPCPLTLTVTCSPKHGNDHTVEFAGRLRAQGHAVIVHLAARMVRGPEHLGSLLERMAATDLHDVFLVGGDRPDPLGPYACAYALLEPLRSHRLAPRTIGVPAYPEGHPLIADDVLREDLWRKAPAADYMTTQLCFDAEVLRTWLRTVRADGLTLPAYIGLPGHVDRRRLLEVSLKVGVGASVSYLRKQHGAGRLAGRRAAAVSDGLLDAVAPLVGGELGIAGMHVYTFNQLTETVRAVEAVVEPAA